MYNKYIQVLTQVCLCGMLCVGKKRREVRRQVLEVREMRDKNFGRGLNPDETRNRDCVRSLLHPRPLSGVRVIRVFRGSLPLPNRCQAGPSVPICSQSPPFHPKHSQSIPKCSQTCVKCPCPLNTCRFLEEIHVLRAEVFFISQFRSLALSRSPFLNVRVPSAIVRGYLPPKRPTDN
jgi:hypothetical protein